MKSPLWVERRARRDYGTLWLRRPCDSWRLGSNVGFAAARRHPAHRWLRSIPALGPLRARRLLAIPQTRRRSRSKRQLWAYAGLALVTRSSAEYALRNGPVVRTDKPLAIRGLNRNHHPQRKELFKGAAITASARPGPWQPF